MKYSYLLFKHLDSEMESKLSRGANQMVSKESQNVIVKSEYCHNSVAKKMKRIRSAFTTEQINYLENEFRKCPYIGSASRKEVSNRLKISERAVKIWFQNRRMREKKESISKELDVEAISKNVTMFTNESLNNGFNGQSTNGKSNHVRETKTNQINISMKPLSETKPPNNVSLNEKLRTCVRPADKNKEVVGASPNNVSNSTFTTINNLAPVAVTVQKGKNKQNVAAASKQENVCNASLKNQNKGPASYCRATNLSTDEDLPQDLSSGSLNALYKQHPQHYAVNSVPGAGFIPLNMQNCYPPSVLPSGNVVWKPVSNMMSPLPVHPPSAISMGINQNSAGLQFVNNNHVKSSCDCNCHGSLERSFNQINARLQPQYILAIPFSNSPK